MVGCRVVGGPVMIHADGGVMFSLADVVINMPSPPYEDNDRDDDKCQFETNTFCNLRQIFMLTGE